MFAADGEPAGGYSTSAAGHDQREKSVISAGLATKQQHERAGELRARAAKLRRWAARLREQALGTATPEGRSALHSVAQQYDEMAAQYDDMANTPGIAGGIAGT